MRNSFEGASLDSVDIDLFHERAIQTLEGARIRESRFSDVYRQEIIDHDMKVVAESERRHLKNSTPEQEELKKVADIFEAIVFDNGDDNEWFGHKTRMVVASKYDDLENGVDSIVEFITPADEPSVHLGLGIDVTFNMDSTKKLERIRRQIEKGRLTQIKYFESPVDGTLGQLRNIPEVIVGTDRATVLELAELWKGRKMGTLSKHKIQISMLLQVKDQLETFAMYAESIGQRGVAGELRKRLEIITEVLKEKKEIFEKVKMQISDDPVHFNITSYLRRLRESIARGEQTAVAA